MADAVLVVTGGLFSLEERALLPALRKQAQSAWASEGVWLDLHLKLGLAERAGAVRQGVRARLPGWEAAARLLTPDAAMGVPELTEVLLCTLLAREGVEVEVATWSALYADPALRERLLARTACVFASTTLLRDLGELGTLAPLLRRPHNRVVAGGALVGILADRWPGCPGVDLLAVGWGELLVPALVSWIRGGFGALPSAGPVRATQAGPTWALRAELPAERSLDALPRPDWALAERLHGRAFTWVSYESVRGCPYRCAFCNYPFLFADTRYRLRSAARIDQDWAELEAQGVRWISCLDSLFTVPRARVLELCARLRARNSQVRWVCYARADDLSSPGLAEELASAGCVQVQIGVESGDQGQLDRMNKRCTVEANLRALEACRRAGMTSLITMIVGFVGETEASVARSLELLRAGRPDLCFITPFSTKFTELPILEPEARARYGLVAPYAGQSAFPAWRHATMDAAEAIEHVERLYQTLAEEELALDGGAFYGGALHHRAEDHAALLRFQRAAFTRAAPWRTALGALRTLSRWGVQRELARLPAAAPRASG